MLTVDFRRFPVGEGDRVLDMGCGGGRHAFEAYRKGARVVAFDHDTGELPPVAGMFAHVLVVVRLPEASAVYVASCVGPSVD